MTVTTTLLALGAMIFWGFGDFFIQRSVKRVGNVQTLFIIGVIGLAILTPFVWSEIYKILTPSNIILVSALGLVTYLAAVSQFRAYEEGKLSVVEVLLSFELPLTIVLGVLFFQESLNLAQIMLILLVIAGIIMVSIRRQHRLLKIMLIKVKVLEKGVLLAALAIVTITLVNFLTALSAKQITPLLAIWAPWVIFTVISFVYLAVRGRFQKLSKQFKKSWPLLLATGVVDTLAWLLFAIVVSTNNLSVTMAITESYPAIAVYLGLKYNREKLSRLQMAGGALAIIASITIALIS
ncbi:MAG: DMT family transporter [Candidatus Komeilibacteria bacterium]|nr:DMT family transporter [Candidatus Komeilibacteria bacterium]